MDNSVNSDLPPLSGDFTFSGGIYRDVYLVVSDQLHFDLLDYASSGVYLETPEINAENARVKIRESILNEHSRRRDFDVVSLIKDASGNVVGKGFSSMVLGPQEQTSFEQLSPRISQPKLWSPENPYLYSVSTQIIDKESRKIIDEVVNPLGFRWFSFDSEEGFSLNGKAYKLIGSLRSPGADCLGGDPYC